MNASQLAAGRLAALLGRLPATSDHFARARERLTTTGQRPLLALVDYDEALVLQRANRQQLLATAQAACQALGMTGWAGRAAALLGEADSAPGHRRPHERPAHGLTRREVEVLQWLAGGQTNRAIAETLALSVPTIERHVANIYTKIGAHGRAAAAVFALRHGLTPIDDER
jgi:DNA-binding NarL/FixJ family response regulator